MGNQSITDHANQRRTMVARRISECHTAIANSGGDNTVGLVRGNGRQTRRAGIRRRVSSEYKLQKISRTSVEPAQL